MYSYSSQVNGKYTHPPPPPPAQGHGYSGPAQGQPYPPHLHISAALSSGWSTGLCHCCDDPANCLITCICPCVTFGQTAEIINKGATPCGISGAMYAMLGLVGMPCLLSCFYRSKMRGQYDLEEGPCADCLVHFCCEPCALCQEYRELRIRGFDMGIGWQANMDRQSRGITMPPIRGSGMTR